MNTFAKIVGETLKVVVPKMVNETTDQNMKDNLPMVVSEGIKLETEKTKDDIALMVVDVVRKEQEHTRVELSLQVSNDVASNIKEDKQARDADFPLWLAMMYKFEKLASYGESSAKRQRTSEKSTSTRGVTSSHVMEESNLSRLGTQEQQEFDAWVEDQGTDDDEMKDDKQAQDADFPLWIVLMYKFEKPASYVDPCRVEAFRKQDHEDHHDDDARHEGESSAKRQRTSEKSTYIRGESSSQIYCLSSGKSSTVAKLLSSVNISSGKIYTNSGKSTLAVGMNMTNSGNALEHFIPNNPPLNLILHLQIKFLE
ncbi:hypothetical protein Tco_0287435 [Tanacetum coccineum]